MPTSGPSLRSVGIFGRVPRACCRIRERAILPQDIEVLCLQRCYILIQAGRILDCATASMEGLTRALAVELAPVRVNIVSPGVVRSPLWAEMAEADREALYRGIAAGTPVGRVGEPAEVAEAYLYLMRQTYGTGQVLVVDGGAVLV